MGAGSTVQRVLSSYVVKRGDIFSRKEFFSVQKVEKYLELTGDSNRIHKELSAAQAAGFDGPLVPGMLCASLFPAIIAKQFPGAVYLTQTLQFRKPVPVDSTVLAEVTVIQVQGRHVRFDTVCTDTRGTVLVNGVALAKMTS